MSSLWNNGISISIFGESHGKAIGVVLDNLPSGETIDMDAVLSFMARRAPKDDLTSTQRREKDIRCSFGSIGWPDDWRPSRSNH